MRASARPRSCSMVFAAWAASVLAGIFTTDLALGAEPEPGSYRVIDGKVDKNTFEGWRVFHSGCHICHGKGAAGTDIAPSLLQRMDTMTPAEFAAKVLVRYRLLYSGDARGAINPTKDREAILEEVIQKKRGLKGRINMPAWEKDAPVNAHILDLFAYLSARSDGRIGAEKPEISPGP